MHGATVRPGPHRHPHRSPHRGRPTPARSSRNRQEVLFRAHCAAETAIALRLCVGVSTAARPRRPAPPGTRHLSLVVPSPPAPALPRAPRRDPIVEPARASAHDQDLDPGPDRDVDRGWRVTWVSGPDAGRSRLLGAGDHVVGRSPLATVLCDDPSLEPFHLRLRLGSTDPDAPSTGVAWCQLTGRRPVEGRGDELVVGTSVLRIEPVAADGTVRLDPVARGVGGAGGAGGVGGAGGTVVRRPRRRVEDPAPPLDPADLADLSQLVRSASAGAGDLRDGGYDGASTTLLPAAVTLAAGVVLALALGQPMLLLMGAVGAVLAFTMWGAGLVRRRRQRRHRALAAAAAAARLDAATSQHRSAVERARRLAHPGLPGAWRTITDASSGSDVADLWARRPDHGDAFTAVVGTGNTVVSALADHAPAITLVDVPSVTDLGPGARVAVTGAWANSLARSLLVQLAVTTGPADWQLVVAVEDEDAWRWTAGLPHVRLTADGAVVHGDAALGELACAAPDGRHLIVVTDAVDRIAVRTAGLRRLLHTRADVALLVTIDDLVPALCITTWVTAVDGSVRSASSGFDTGPPAEGVATASTRSSIHGLGIRAASEAADLLSRWIDPEAPADDRRLGGDVGLEALWAGSGLTIERRSIARRWRAAAADAAPAAPVGAATEGAVEIDLVRDGPHALVAGTTGSGKSELLRSLVLSLATSVSPAQLAFVLVDFKGGATFDGLAGLPHVAGVVTDLEPRLAARVLRSLRAEVTRREHLLRTLGHPDLPSARAATGTPVAPRLAIVVDEFAALAIEHPQLLHALVDVARRGRSLGVHLVLATQRPAGVVSEEIRTNTDLRIALRLHEAAEAMEVVGDPSPAAIRRDAAGRAVMRLGPGELLPFQTARPADARAMVEEIRQAATSLGLGPATRPWCDPLPELLDDADEDEGEDGSDRLDRLERLDRLGLVDLPDEQRQDDLGWVPADGHVLVVGSVGSGVTTALAGLAVRRLAPEAELVVVDATGDPRWALVADHPRCAVVAPLHEVELVDRALRRAVATPPAGGRVVVVDGLGVLRRELEPLHRTEAREQLESLVLSPPPGVTLVLGNDGTAGLGPAVVSRCARRYVLHLHDPSEAAGLGVRAADVPSAVPGRFVDATLGCEGQFASWPAARLATRAHDGRLDPVARVTTLPADVAAGALPASWSDERSWFVPVGVAHDDLRPVAFEVPHGEHLLVIGPARSGRSEVLAGFRRSWSQARPEAAQVVIAPRRLSGEALVRAVAEAVEQVDVELAAGRPVLLVIDDADLVADAGGALAAAVSGHRPLLTMAVACRPDSVRSTYGHWAASLRRHRRGVLMAACDELDGDLLGAVLPRHLPVAARPGLCWLVGDGTARLVQAARRGDAV